MAACAAFGQAHTIPQPAPRLAWTTCAPKAWTTHAPSAGPARHCRQGRLPCTPPAATQEHRVASPVPAKARVRSSPCVTVQRRTLRIRPRHDAAPRVTSAHRTPKSPHADRASWCVPCREWRRLPHASRHGGLAWRSWRLLARPAFCCACHLGCFAGGRPGRRPMHHRAQKLFCSSWRSRAWTRQAC